MQADTTLAPTDAQIDALWGDDHLLSVPQLVKRRELVRVALARFGRAPQAPAASGVPLTPEQVFKAAEGTLLGNAHRLIHGTDPEYAAICDMEPGTRWICSEVRPEHSLAFARAIEAAHGITKGET